MDSNNQNWQQGISDCTRTQDRHKAPTLPRIRPLSLQTGAMCREKAQFSYQLHLPLCLRVCLCGEGGRPQGSQPRFPSTRVPTDGRVPPYELYFAVHHIPAQYRRLHAVFRHLLLGNAEDIFAQDDGVAQFAGG